MVLLAVPRTRALVACRLGAPDWMERQRGPPPFQTKSPVRSGPPNAWFLPRRFNTVGPAATTHVGMLAGCNAHAQALPAEPREKARSMATLHLGNVLDFGAIGWLAIDPKACTAGAIWRTRSTPIWPTWNDRSRPCRNSSPGIPRPYPGRRG